MTAIIQTHEETLHVPNVVGVVEGSDPALKNEYIVVGAHLDHLGVRSGETYNGADDNATGSTAVMEVSEAVAMAPPKRSVIFACFTGEERGLLGSRHFVENPPVPLKQIKDNINIEMIGRWSHRPIGSKEIVAILSDIEKETLEKVLIKVNEMGFGYQLDIPERFQGGSDHVAFNSVGIPNITIAGSPPDGTHEDYHRPTDDAEKIDFAAMRKAAALIYELTMELANRID
jgi:Zn-dependent M28 family amino/carboxypeptidase